MCELKKLVRYFDAISTKKSGLNCTKTVTEISCIYLNVQM